jgi:hypothetical protein
MKRKRGDIKEVTLPVTAVLLKSKWATISNFNFFIIEVDIA